MQTREVFQKTWVKSVLEQEGQELYNNYYSKYYSKHLLTKLAKYAFIYSEGCKNKNNPNKIQSIKDEIKSLFSEYFEKHKNQFNCNITVEQGLDNNPLSLACKTGDEEIHDKLIHNITKEINESYNNLTRELREEDINPNNTKKLVDFFDDIPELKDIRPNYNYNSDAVKHTRVLTCVAGALVVFGACSQLM